MYMKKRLLLFFTALITLTAGAQVSESEKTIVRNLVSNHSAAIGLSTHDLANYLVSSTYESEEGVRYAYLQQSYKGIPVYNQLHVLAFRNGRLVSKTGGRIAGIEQKVNQLSGTPVVPVTGAVRASLDESNLRTTSSIRVLNEENQKYYFGRLGVSQENISAELIWVPVSDKEVKLAWQVFVVPVNADDMWLVRIDALNGNVIGKDNLTVYDAWDHGDHAKPVKKENSLYIQPDLVRANPNQDQHNLRFRIPVVNSASYRVVPYPAESPTHPGGTPVLVTDPWLLAPGNATTLKWHNDGTTDHDSTRGNNVWAAEDRNNTNSVIDKAAVSQTPQPNLTFDYVPDFTVSPIVTNPPNQQFNITNLFYWNNIIHDITYLYGFTEPAGNFQNDNQGRGGAGNDYVIGDAQDGGGTNNANFSTPADGLRPRMQMYIWTSPNPDRDGDADNSIVVHEFGHGISNRLTGGPTQTGCVSNAEHGGEGWSDYYALMLTTNWATATAADGFNIPRGIGTYALGQPPTGSGIRNFRYCTNLSVNPLVYSATLPSQTHNRGEYWCMALWEMTWEMIQQTGINPDLFNPSGSGGNSAALKLVTEAMKLQPCGPGFIDARNAILQADTIFFGGLYSCSIWKAFAKRGMGRNALQGSASSVTDQTPDFTVDNGFFKITQSAPQVPEGQNVTYTNTVTAGVCSPMSNFFITDTLPTSVTYVSGGSYNPANRTVLFGPVNLTSGQSQAFPFTVTINNGTYFAPVTHFNEQVTGATIPAAWTINPASGNTWSVSSAQSNSSPNAFFAPNLTVVTDMSLANANSYTLTAGVSAYSTLSFWHRFNTEEGWDGGVVEISTNGGGTWTDLGSRMITGKYNGSLGTGSALAGRGAFTGNSGTSFINTIVNLSSFAGQSVRIRFRFASDNNTAPSGGGWYVDDVVLYSEPAVYMKSNLFNGSSQLVSITDTITKIQVGVPSCTSVNITTQPVSVNGCTGGNASFTVATTGTSPAYQWQVNTGSGFTDLTNTPPYSGVNSATLNITNITAGMNGYQFRCMLSNSCTAAFASGSASLNVSAVASITTQPSSSTVCEGVSTSFSVVATGATSYQWQVNTGSGFVNVANGGPYSGASTATLNITAPTVAFSGYQYRCVLGSCGAPVNTNAATLTISVPVSITAQPVNATVCEGTNTSFTVAITGSASSFQWQISTDGGTTFVNISGANGATLNLPSVAVGQNGYRYRCIVTGSCGPVTSSAALLTVNALPVFTLSGYNPASVCVSDPSFTLNASAVGGTWSGNGVQGTTFNPAVAGIGNTTVTYSLTISGCTTSLSTVIGVNECPERHIPLSRYPAIIVYPNPNGGLFNIRVNTDLYTRLGMKVFNNKGQLLKTRQFTGVGYGSVLPVDLSFVPNGTYQLYIYNDENGDFTGKGISVIITRN